MVIVMDDAKGLSVGLDGCTTLFSLVKSCARGLYVYVCMYVYKMHVWREANRRVRAFQHMP